jgi:hypothetical protein
MKFIFLTAGAVFMINTLAFSEAFQNVGETPRSKAMGNAVFADFDGFNTMNLNPATISMARSLQVYSSWDNPYSTLNDESSINTLNFSAVIPFWSGFTIGPDPFVTKRAAIGLSVYRMGNSGIDSDGSTVEFYHEAIYSLTYAKDLNDVISKGAKISLGVKFNLYDIGLGNSVDVRNNPNISQTQRLSFGMDVGATYDFSQSIRLGLAYKNLIAPNISILADGQDILPGELRFGVNWEIGDILSVLKKSKLGFGYVSYGRDPNDNRQADNSWNLGFEFKQLTAQDIIKNSFKGEILAVRLGAIYQQTKVGDTLNLLGLTLTGSLDLSGGIGLMYVLGQSHQINLDYTIDFGLNMGAIRHALALSYQLLLPNSAFAYREAERKEMQMEEKMMEEAEHITNLWLTNYVFHFTNNRITNYLLANYLGTNYIATNYRGLNVILTNFPGTNYIMTNIIAKRIPVTNYFFTNYLGTNFIVSHYQFTNFEFTNSITTNKKSIVTNFMLIIPVTNTNALVVSNQMEIPQKHETNLPAQTVKSNFPPVLKENGNQTNMVEAKPAPVPKKAQKTAPKK